MEKLPNEIVLQIFNNFKSPSHLLQCRLVCHRWSDLADLALASRPPNFWRSSCLLELGEFICDSLVADTAFDRFFSNFIRPSVDELKLFENEELWRAIYCAHFRLTRLRSQKMACCFSPLCRISFSSSLRISEVVLHGNFLYAVAAGPEMSIGCLFMALLPSSTLQGSCGPKLGLKPFIFHSSPGVFHGLSVMSGFPVPGCPELVGPQLDICPMCNASPTSLIASSAAHVTVQIVHKYRGLELIGLCLRDGKVLPKKMWWRQSTRPVDGSCCFIASLHKGVCQVVYRRRECSYRHLYHLHAGCEGCTTHEQKILTSGQVLAAATTECCSAELFELFSGDRSHRLQATMVWGDQRGAGAVADDLRCGTAGAVPIAATALLLQDPTALVAFSRVESATEPGGLDTWTHCLTERDLSRPERPKAQSVLLGDLSRRRVVRLAAKGPVTVLGTDAGKVLALHAPPRGLAAAIARHHSAEAAGEDSGLVLMAAATDGRSVSSLHMSLTPSCLRVAIATLGDFVFLLLF